MTPPTLALGGWTHSLDPVALNLFGTFALRWYGLSYLAGFVAAYFLLRLLAVRGATLIPKERALDAILTLVVGVMVGGRLGYVLLYDPSLLGLIDGFPWWGVLAINRGGMASHGGIAGVIVTAWWISRGFKAPDGTRIGACPPTHAMDICALIAPVGLMFGRLANFINGELLGKIVAAPGQTAPWWAVRYPQEVLTEPYQRLVQTPEHWAAIERLGRESALPGEDWERGFDRLLTALQRGDAAAHAAIEPLISTRHPTQLYQALIEGVAVGLVVWLVAAKKRKPGVVGAWFLIVYALGRIATDFVRLPDAGVAQFGGVTRGQAYSGLMLLAGVVVLVWASRRAAERVTGGWLRRA
ncbi:MAG: prolipoprotein diacylglyceryl transferase [Phycisphaerales bacterium]|nr:prolipoprotein diacylglyceryl transferase [Planctomycetota bacterium]MCH8509146.1 prolipoprotein diacylglyceryl transferase [Phycisphaerales bacterium]